MKKLKELSGLKIEGLQKISGGAAVLAYNVATNCCTDQNGTHCEDFETDC